jgi:hypothetical protein
MKQAPPLKRGGSTLHLMNWQLVMYSSLGATVNRKIAPPVWLLDRSEKIASLMTMLVPLHSYRRFLEGSNTGQDSAAALIERRAAIIEGQALSE